MQYFVETDTEGTPINRIFRSLIYQRSKGVNDTTPFGTKVDVYRIGYEWMDHSIYAKMPGDINKRPKIKIGNNDCRKPYNASLLNISAMSYGALSNNAVMAFNKGAKLGDFAHNTGEGGISPYHLKFQGDLIWQIGTGYFGCRDKYGNFSEEIFKEKAALESVKMIEIKVSQGAKPGHGGILPGNKNTKEIAKIRGVKPYSTIFSPPAHTAFYGPLGLINFVKLLKEISGKPVGFKICVGKKSEVLAICMAMLEIGVKPDFITIDGGEGGTGAAPVEFTNSLGMPLRDGLSFMHDILSGFGIRKDIKLIASGKILSAFHIARVIALGADLCYSARAMMMAAGCIQALKCNENTCPAGITTQNKSLIKGLNVEDKSKRIASFHKETLQSFTELIAAAGIDKPEKISRDIIKRRVNMNAVMSYSEIYPYLEEGCLLKLDAIPKKYEKDFREAEELLEVLDK